jgi:dUTP pyrophosphatase
MKLKFTTVKDVQFPLRGTPGSAGIDFFIPVDIDEKLLTVHPNCSTLIPSGIKANVPENHALIAFNKSGVASKLNLQVGACVVDSDYQGEIHIHLHNIGKETVTLQARQKIVQFLLVPVNHSEFEYVSESNLYETETERGIGGFGSTDNK